MEAGAQQIKPTGLLNRITVIALIVLIVACCYDAFTPKNFSLLGDGLFAAFVGCIALALFHAVRAAKTPQFRRKHNVWALCCALAVVLLFPPTVYFHRKTMQHWFLETQLSTYNRMAETIMAHREFLSDRLTSVSHLVGRPNVYAATNDDGAITIRFLGRYDGSQFDYLRVGWLFYSASNEISNSEGAHGVSVGPSKEYLHLTNGWYEY